MTTPAHPDVRDARDARIHLRASARQEQLIKAAAAASDKTTTDFVLETAVVQAEKVLADRRYFYLSQDQWDRLDALLEAALEPNPQLAALMAEPSPFGTATR